MMRTILLVLFAASALAGFQAERRTYVFDPEGRRSLWSSATTGDARRISTGRDMNGRETRVEEVQEKVLRDSGGVKVVERLIRRFDPNGRPLPPEKELVETTTRAGGAVSTATTTFKADLNGRLQPAERVVEEVRESGSRTTTETRVERPNINGAFAPVER